MTDNDRLVAAARAAREHACARFSGFKVGAALLTPDGSIISGCNIENATYGLTVCAERVAMFKALSEGHRAFVAVAVVADAAVRSLPADPVGVRRRPRSVPRQPDRAQGDPSPQRPPAAAVRRQPAVSISR